MVQRAAIFTAVFLAEFGDKTRPATLLFACNAGHPPLRVFAAATLALCRSTALAVLVGTFASRFVDAVAVKLIAGIGFVAFGGWTRWEHFRAA
jgi:putative Ca2+/H+ antiporter (TMEM165/GDT1 family)